MDFNGLLRSAEIDLRQVSIVLHKPGDLKVRAILATFIEQRPELFEAYQSTHPPLQEATVKSRCYLASFFMRDPGELVFLALYEVKDWSETDVDGLAGDPIFSEMLLKVDGVSSEDISAHISSRLAGRARFDFRRTAHLAELGRRLVVADPGGRNYVRRADTTDLEVLELKREARITSPVPPWDQISIDAPEIEHLPNDWASSLRHWRGIYLILDLSDGARYVGSAYGRENLLGRWRVHTASATGVTKELRKRDTRHFRFSILALVSPTATPEEVVARERSWMKRIGTIDRGLNT